MKAPPEEIKLSREAGDALIERLEANTVTSEDRRLLIKLIRLYFWFTFALSEPKISLKRLKRVLFGGSKPPPPSSPTGGGSSGSAPGDAVAGGGAPPSAAAPRETPGPDRPLRRQGHGHHGATVYTGAKRVVCRHETLAAGQPCPACGRGTLYPLPAGVEIRVDGNALLSAVRYELEKLRCSACGEVFTAAVPATVGAEKYSPQARAVMPWAVTTWDCPSLGSNSIKRWSGCRSPMPR